MEVQQIVSSVFDLANLFHLICHRRWATRKHAKSTPVKNRTQFQVEKC